MTILMKRNRADYPVETSGAMHPMAMTEPSIAPRSPGNPFDRASEELATQWDVMVNERDTALDEAERHRSENVYLASELDRVKKELATLTDFHALEIDRQTRRADAAVAREADLRGRLDLIGKAIAGVVAEVANTAPFAPPKTGSNGGAVSQGLVVSPGSAGSVPVGNGKPVRAINVRTYGAPGAVQMRRDIERLDQHAASRDFRVQADPDEQDDDEQPGDLKNLMDRVAGLHRL